MTDEEGDPATEGRAVSGGVVRLVLLRHGVAEQQDAEAWPDDRGRPLTNGGRRKVRAAAAGLRKLGLTPDAILTSGLSRAQETAALVGEALGLPSSSVRALRALEPDGEPRGLWRALARREGTVLIVGHEPDLSGLASLVATGEATALSLSLGKAGAAVLDLTGRPGPASGRLSGVLRPRWLRALAG